MGDLPGPRQLPAAPLPSATTARAVTATDGLEAELIAEGLYSPPPAARLQPPPEMLPQTLFKRRARQWPWYALQIGIFIGFQIADHNLRWSGGNPYFSAFASFMAAFVATITIVGTIGAVRRLARRPVVLWSWLAAVAALNLWGLQIFGLPASLTGFAVGAIWFGALSAYLTIFFAWLARPMFFRMPLFPPTYSAKSPSA